MTNANFIPPVIQEPVGSLSLDLSLDGSNTRVISNIAAVSQGLLTPYLQQSNVVNNHMNPMAIELWGQLKNLEGKASACVQARDYIIKDLSNKNEELEAQVRRAIAEAHYWKVTSEKKTALCKDLAGRLLKIKRNGTADKMPAEEINFAEDAVSSTGDNVDVARTRKCKRPRV